MPREPITRPIQIFTPSFADIDSTNAQNLTVKEIIAHLPEHLFRVVMMHQGTPDSRIVARQDTTLLAWRGHGNTLRGLGQLLVTQPDIYFYPRQGPLDSAVFSLRKVGLLRAAVVTHVVMVMNPATGVGLIGRSIREGDAVFANSSYVAETVQQEFGVKAGTIFNGIDRRFFFPQDDPARPRTEALTVLYAGSFQERKRIDVVIRQAARWPKVTFKLAGGGETEPGCRALVQRLGCHNVVFLGHLTLAQLGEEMRRSDVFLFPSILEGHPQVLGQAAGCGLPSVAMKLYRPEYVVHEESGFLVESEAELAVSLGRLLCNPDLRKSMSAAAVRHSRKFEWKQIARQWAEVFQRVAKR
jgi:glycosyltransferase involved in cell wall biosynthesis